MPDTTSQPWATPTTVGLWGPPVDIPKQVQPALPDLPDLRRRHKSWGIGDIWIGVAGLVASQVLILIGVVVIAVAHLGPVDGQDPLKVLDEVSNIGDSATKNPVFLLIALITQWLSFVGPAVYAARRKGRGSLSNTFGFRFRKIDPLIGIGIALVAQGAFALFTNVIVPALGIDQTGSDNTGQVTDNTGVFLLIMTIAGAVGAPFVEELFFRGLVFGALAKRLGKTDLYAPADSPADSTLNTKTTGQRRIGIVLSALLSALFFGSMHATTGADGQFHAAGALLLVFQTGSLGFVFALVAAKARRLGPTICAHVAFNSSSIALVLLLK